MLETDVEIEIPLAKLFADRVHENSVNNEGRFQA